MDSLGQRSDLWYRLYIAVYSDTGGLEHFGASKHCKPLQLIAVGTPLYHLYVDQIQILGQMFWYARFLSLNWHLSHFVTII
jgi:hypothetical protein